MKAKPVFALIIVFAIVVACSIALSYESSTMEIAPIEDVNFEDNLPLVGKASM